VGTVARQCERGDAAFLVKTGRHRTVARHVGAVLFDPDDPMTMQSGTGVKRDLD